MIKLFLITLVFVAFVALCMGIRILFVKGSIMSNTSVGGNKNMRQKKVYCIKTQDKLERYKLKKELNKKSGKTCSPELCGSCGC